MAYRKDKDLEFLAELEDKYLDLLVEIITTDPKDRKYWISETLTKNKNFKRYYPAHSHYWKEIAEEIQYWGANSIISLIRKNGVLYQEIVSDVAKKVKANIDGLSSIEEKENAILLKLFSDSLERMNEKERMALIKEMNLVSPKDFSTEAITLACQVLFKVGGVQSFQLTALISNAVANAVMGKAMVLAGNAALARGVAFLTGPVGLGITALWTAFDLAGPAYRVTIPTVVQIAFLRQTYNSRKEELLKEINKHLF